MPGEETQYALTAIHELARAELSMSLPVYTLLTIGWGGEFIAIYGNEETKKEVLPKLASGNGRGECPRSRAAGVFLAARLLKL